MKLVAWAQSDTGMRREHNEDSFLVDESLHLFAVADGMGGHKGGARASRLALDVLHDVVDGARSDLEAGARALKEESLRQFADAEPFGEDDEFRKTEEVPVARRQTERTLDLSVAEEDIESMPPATAVARLAVRKASSAVHREASKSADLRGMGTTLTAMFFDGGRMHVVHAGDSRAYLFRDGTLQQLTDDHSWIGEQLRAGRMTEEEAKESQFKHIITRSIGFERDVEVDSVGVAVQAGDCYLLCSDGMSNYVENDELERLMADNWYRRLPQVLIDLANDRGGDDNITVVVVYAGNDKS